ncbi:MAG: hypothetical protein C4335_11320 [Armatimonadota bacterium]
MCAPSEALWERLATAWYHERYDDVIKIGEQVLNIQPNDALVLHAVGQAYAQLGEPLKALQYYERALHADPQSRSSLKGKLWALFHLQRYDEAMATANRLLEEEPANAWLLQIIAQICAQVERWSEARYYWERLLSMDPGNVTAIRHYIWALYRLAEYGEVERWANYLMEKVLGDLWDMQMVADSRLALGKSADAKGRYEAMLKMDPTNQQALRGLLWSLVHLRRYAQAQAVMERVQIDTPEGLEFAQEYVLHLIKRRRWREAKQMLSRIASAGLPYLPPQSALCLERLAWSYSRTQQWQEARILYEHLSRSSLDLIRVRGLVGLAYCDLHLRDYQNALTEAEVAAMIAGKTRDVWSLKQAYSVMVFAYLRRRAHRKAWNAFQKMLRLTD